MKGVKNSDKLFKYIKLGGTKHTHVRYLYVLVKKRYFTYNLHLHLHLHIDPPLVIYLH